MFVMLQGLPAARKSTAIKIGTKVLKDTGYVRFASDRMSRQTFLDEMYRINQPENLGITEEEQWDLPLGGDWPYEMTIHAREFIDFIGQNDKDYLMLLTNLYDNLPEYSNPKLSSKSVMVKKPTINFLGASTSENLNMAFPSSAMDTGTLSRILFIHANPARKEDRILLPTRPAEDKRVKLIKTLEAIKETVKGEFLIDSGAIEVLDFIYKNQEPLDDPRFQYYAGRRLDHLFKLCMIHAASRVSMTITLEDVLSANTVLGVAEYHMPKALGHFGRSKQSIVMHSLLEYIENHNGEVTLRELYQNFVSDFGKETEFSSMIMDLQNSRKLESKAPKVAGGQATIQLIARKIPAWLRPLLTPEILTDQERQSVNL